MDHYQQAALAFDVDVHDDTTRIAATSPTPDIGRSAHQPRRPDHSQGADEARPNAPTKTRRTRPSRKHTLAAFPHGNAAGAVDDPPSPAPSPLLLTIAEAGRLLTVGRTTMYELIGSGEVEVVHIGRAALIPIESVERFVERLRSVSYPYR